MKSSYRMISVSCELNWLMWCRCVSLNISFVCLSHFTDLGVRQPRLEGEEYLEIIDEFMEAAFTRWPKAVVQVYIS